MTDRRNMKDMLDIEERVNLELRKLYSSYGYRKFKMSKFEEYDLYTKNRNFIPSESIIAFTGGKGKLLALRPDVTLSIAKNHRPVKCETEKVFYSESIYRADKEGVYKEIIQTGLECMGNIDDVQIDEVISLALRSLECISNEFILDVSHMGLLSECLKGVPENLRGDILKCISEKNRMELKMICKNSSLDEDTEKILISLIDAAGECKKACELLKRTQISSKASLYLESLERTIYRIGDKKINIDFSIVSNMTYYSGIVFKGYVKGIPDAVLSGGEYEGLMRYMGKDSNAMGFAVYLDNLKKGIEQVKGPDIDILFIYGDEPTEDILREAKQLRDKGYSVITERKVPKDMTFGKIVEYTEGRVKKVE